MNKYKIENKLGGGAFGSVFKAVHRSTGLRVAIKKLKKRYDTWEECLTLQEVEALRHLRHSAIVQLYEVIREENRLYLVFEFVGPNLYQVIENRLLKPLPEAKVRSWLRQVLQGLAHIHESGCFHRDIKPENLLVKGSTIKIADLGLVRPTSKPKPCTDYVSTRWYRAPEVLLRAPDYGPPVDLFAVGAVAAELFNLRPLFPGTSEPDQLACIAAVLGSPTQKNWPAGVALAERMGLRFPFTPPAQWEQVLPSASPHARDLIASMCHWNPIKRPSAPEALQHPFFHPDAPLTTVDAAELRSRLTAATQRIAARAADVGRESGDNKEDYALHNNASSNDVGRRSTKARSVASIYMTRSLQLQRLVATATGRQEASLHKQQLQLGMPRGRHPVASSKNLQNR